MGEYISKLADRRLGTAKGLLFCHIPGIKALQGVKKIKLPVRMAMY